ncbi:Transposon Tf2-9 polyprotein [Morella rubra]|uniref:Transposon Tf2-9 polyprotein n=1 Tax=Morella rubra TaxID=262757 RepID=A0A6A1VGY2_9ROSI|nr:Transposon Tf2-9 polyprotein [Morella rubra]
MQEVKLNYSIVYHPQTDGQTKSVNKCIESYLRCMVGDKPKGWETWLALAEWHHNTSMNFSSKMTPFEDVYGYLPPCFPSYESGTTAVEAVDETLRNRDQILFLLSENPQKAQNCMKKICRSKEK